MHDSAKSGLLICVMVDCAIQWLQFVRFFKSHSDINSKLIIINLNNQVPVIKME